MEEDIDIYEDLPNFAVERSGNPEGFKEEQTSHVHKELNKRISELTAELEQSRKVNQNLVVNLTSLLKTAKAEISRKDKIIDTLRKELDDTKFRRSARARCGPRVTDKPTIQQESVPSVLQEPSDTQSLEIDSTACDTMDSFYEQPIKRGQKQSTANNVSNTLFSERLCKRIANSEHVEKTTGGIDNFNNDSNSCGSAQGYVQESDKENRNVPTTWSHSHTINKLDSNLSDLQKSSLPSKCSTKRTNTEPNGSTASKRLKIASQEEEITKKNEESAGVMHNSQLQTSKWQELEGHAHHLEKKCSSKYVDAKYEQDTYNRCTYQHPNESTKQYNRKGGHERSSYRHSVDRGFEKNERRRHNDLDYEDQRKNKQHFVAERQEKRSEVYRSRRRSPYNAPYQDDRSDRGKYDKHTNRRVKYDKSSRNDKGLDYAYKTTNRRDPNNRRSSSCASDSKYSSRWRSSGDSLEKGRRGFNSREISLEKKSSSYSTSTTATTATTATTSTTSSRTPVKTVRRSQSRENRVEDTGYSTLDTVGKFSPEKDNLQIVLDETDSEFTNDCRRNSLTFIKYEDGEIIDASKTSPGNIKLENPTVREPPTTEKLDCPRKLTNGDRTDISGNLDNSCTLVHDLKSESKIKIENNENSSVLDGQAYHILVSTSFSKEECVENIEKFIRGFDTKPTDTKIKSAHDHIPTQAQDKVHHALEDLANQYDVKLANNTEGFDAAKSQLSSVADPKELIVIRNCSNQFRTLDTSIPCDYQETPRIVTKTSIINTAIQELKTDTTTTTTTTTTKTTKTNETQKDTQTESFSPSVSPQMENIADVESILTDEKPRMSSYSDISKEISGTRSEEVEATEELNKKSSAKNFPHNNSESHESNVSTGTVAASAASEKNLELQVKCKNQAHSRAECPSTNIINHASGVQSTVGESPNNHRKSTAPGRNASIQAGGKLVIFARRKNPVRLVDKNANMTTADPAATISLSTPSKLKTAVPSNSDGNTDFSKLSRLRKIGP